MSTSIEVYLSGFINTVRHSFRAGKLSQAHIDILNQYIPGWNEDSLDNRWSSGLKALEDSYKKLGRLPNRTEPGGAFLREQRRVKRTKPDQWSEQRQASLDAICPGWETLGTRDSNAIWMSHYEAAVEYYKETGKIPTGDHPEAGWVNVQRHLKKSAGTNTNAGTWTDEKKELMDQGLPGWDDDGRMRIWRESATRVASRIKDGTPLEDRDKSFLKKQRAAYRSGDKNWSKEKESFMDEFIPGWRD